MSPLDTPFSRFPLPAIYPATLPCPFPPSTKPSFHAPSRHLPSHPSMPLLAIYPDILPCSFPASTQTSFHSLSRHLSRHPPTPLPTPCNHFLCLAQALRALRILIALETFKAVTALTALKAFMGPRALEDYNTLYYTRLNPMGALEPSGVGLSP